MVGAKSSNQLVYLGFRKYFHARSGRRQLPRKYRPEVHLAIFSFQPQISFSPSEQSPTRNHGAVLPTVAATLLPLRRQLRLPSRRQRHWEEEPCILGLAPGTTAPAKSQLLGSYSALVVLLLNSDRTSGGRLGPGQAAGRVRLPGIRISGGCRRDAAAGRQEQGEEAVTVGRRAVGARPRLPRGTHLHARTSPGGTFVTTILDSFLVLL